MKSSDISAKYIKDINIKRLKALSEKEIKDKVSDYYTKYFAVYHLQSLAQSNPGIIDPETIVIIQDLLKDPQYSGKRQGFLFSGRLLKHLELLSSTPMKNTWPKRLFPP